MLAPSAGLWAAAALPHGRAGEAEVPPEPSHAVTRSGEGTPGPGCGRTGARRGRVPEQGRSGGAWHPAAPAGGSRSGCCRPSSASPRSVPVQRAGAAPGSAAGAELLGHAGADLVSSRSKWCLPHCPRHVALCAQGTVTKNRRWRKLKTSFCGVSCGRARELGMLLWPRPVWADWEGGRPAEQCWSLGGRQGAFQACRQHPAAPHRCPAAGPRSRLGSAAAGIPPAPRRSLPRLPCKHLSWCPADDSYTSAGRGPLPSSLAMRCRLCAGRGRPRAAERVCRSRVTPVPVCAHAGLCAGSSCRALLKAA